VIERDAGAAQKFLREARTAAACATPTSSTSSISVPADGPPYFVMEAARGPSLRGSGGRRALPPGEVVVIARQLANAARRGPRSRRRPCRRHAVQLCWSSAAPIRSANRLHVKLVDFGLGRARRRGLRDENPEFVLGTRRTISPEQLRGLAPTDRSDQYGLGAVLFELLTGRAAVSPRRSAHAVPDAPHRADPDRREPARPLPPKLADIVHTGLQKDAAGPGFSPACARCWVCAR